MASVIHVFVGRVFGAEFFIASFTLEMKIIVAESTHMLVCRMLACEIAIASLAFEYWSPMTQCIHMLVHSKYARELASAGVTFVGEPHVGESAEVSRICPRFESRCSAVPSGMRRGRPQFES